MFVTVFIPTGNRARSLDRTLRSLEKQRYKKFEVLVVDYHSTDETPKVVQSMSKSLMIRLIHQTEKGLAQAANLALSQAKGDIFIRTDDDVVMKPGWLEAIVKTFETDTQVGGVTGPTIIPKAYRDNRDLFAYEDKFRNGPWYWRLVGSLYLNVFMEGRPYAVSEWFDSGAFGLGSNFETARREKLHEITNLEACNFSVRTKLLKQVGGFDEGYSGVGEYHEADAAWKIKTLGYKLMFQPKAELNHLPSQDGFFADRPASYPRMINFIVFYLRHIKINSWSKLTRFFLYIAFQNCYYIYTAIATRQMAQLGAIPGTVMGFVVYFQRKK